jgi:hypothetical protein
MILDNEARAWPGGREDRRWDVVLVPLPPPSLLGVVDGFLPTTYSAAIVSLGDLVEGGVNVLHETEGEPWTEGDGGAQRGGEVDSAK